MQTFLVLQKKPPESPECLWYFSRVECQRKRIKGSRKIHLREASPSGDFGKSPKPPYFPHSDVPGSGW